MAKIQEQQVIIKLYKLVKDVSEESSLVDNEFLENIEAVVQELVDPAVLVEILTE